jgi:hypothetical protein
MLDFAIAPSVEDFDDAQFPIRLSLGGALYWFLHWYFVRANLEHGSYDFLSQYEDTEVSGYQLIRLRHELECSLLDLSARPSSFPVLTGWTGSEKEEAAEDWRDLEREEASLGIRKLLELIDEARDREMCVVAIGD